MFILRPFTILLHHQLAEKLASALGFHTVFVGKRIQRRAGFVVRTLAVWSHGARVENFEYALADTPCERVYDAGLLTISRNAKRCFPEHPVLGKLTTETYLAAVLENDDGEPIGHIAALDDRPILDARSSETILRIFSAQAAKELGRRSVEARLRNVEDNFRLLFEQSPNAIILFDPETWKPIEFNNLAAEFMGYDRQEFSELTITDLELNPNPDETRAHIARIVESGDDVFEALHKGKDGASRHVIVSLRMTMWKKQRVMLTLWHDITARKKVEQALEASERRLQSIFDTAMDAIVIVDGTGRIVRLNPASEQVFRCKAAAMLGEPIQRLFPKSVITQLFTHARADQRDTASGSVWAPKGLDALRRNGEVFPVELTFSPFEIDGVSFYTLILRDVNDRQRAETELRNLQEDKRVLQERLSESSTIVGTSPAVAGVLSHVEKVAATDSTVLILGETGTGKELVARTIHDRSARRKRVMVTVNCAALPKDLIESELFGHEEGAFTGATQRKRGRFEVANGGSLFLDEVGELSPEGQAKLLRVLQEGEIQRVGGETSIRVSVRVIAATHRDLMADVETGRFRSDLYYRLSVFPLRFPPLRERRTDIPLLVEHFVSIYSRRFGKPLKGFDPASADRLIAYHWPGNVRELQNVIERAAILSEGSTLTLDGSLLQNPTDGMDLSADDLDETMRRHMRHVLKDCRWVIEGPHGAAKRLGINPSTLRFRIRKLGIVKP